MENNLAINLQSDPEPAERPDIFDYLDYRKFLQDVYAYKKATSTAFSYRSFSRLAGFRSSNFFKFVMEGKRNLSLSAIYKFASALHLKEDEMQFFTNLVLFNQSKSIKEKNHYYEQILQMSGYTKAKPLETSQYAYFSKWYLVALRELVTLRDFQEDPKWINRRLGLALSETEIRKSIQILLDLNLLKRDGKNRLRPCEARVTTAPELTDLGIINYHREMIQKAHASIEKSHASHRDLSALTVSLNKKQFEQIKEEIARFRSRIHSLTSDADGDAEAVYQINFHLFNLSEVPWS